MYRISHTYIANRLQENWMSFGSSLTQPIFDQIICNERGGESQLSNSTPNVHIRCFKYLFSFSFYSFSRHIPFILECLGICLEICLLSGHLPFRFALLSVCMHVIHSLTSPDGNIQTDWMGWGSFLDLFWALSTPLRYQSYFNECVSVLKWIVYAHGWHDIYANLMLILPVPCLCVVAALC